MANVDPVNVSDAFDANCREAGVANHKGEISPMAAVIKAGLTHNAIAIGQAGGAMYYFAWLVSDPSRGEMSLDQSLVPPSCCNACRAAFLKQIRASVEACESGLREKGLLDAADAPLGLGDKDG